MTDKINPRDPDEGWIARRDAVPHQRDMPHAIVEVVGSDLIPTGVPGYARGLCWEARVPDGEPIAYWRPWMIDEATVWRVFKDGSTETFSRKIPSEGRLYADVRRVLTGEYQALVVETGGRQWRIDKDGITLVPPPKADAYDNLCVTTTTNREPLRMTRDLDERLNELLVSNNGYQAEARQARADADRWRTTIAQMLKAAGLPDASPDSENLCLAVAAIDSQFRKMVEAAAEARGDVTNAERYSDSLADLIRRCAEKIDPAAETMQMDMIRQTFEAAVTNIVEKAGEVEALNLIIANTATALGATIAPGTSLTFKGKLPYEAETKIAGLEDTIRRQAGTIATYRTADREAGGKAERPAPIALKWVNKNGITSAELADLIEQPNVYIRTSPGGIWRHRNETNGGNGYCDDARDADTWPGLLAWNSTKHCGPEKDVQFGIPADL